MIMFYINAFKKEKEALGTIHYEKNTYSHLMEATSSMQKTVKTKMNVLDHIFIIVVRSQ